MNIPKYFNIFLINNKDGKQKLKFKQHLGINQKIGNII